MFLGDERWQPASGSILAVVLAISCSLIFTAGYLLWASFTHFYTFDYHVGEVYACVADIGWITGHSYIVYGPLCNGATTVMFESLPTYPDAGRHAPFDSLTKFKYCFISIFCF